MILVLPGLFGITLIGDGIVKVLREEWSGIISIIFGMACMGLVVFAYLFFTSFLKYHQAG